VCGCDVNVSLLAKRTKQTQLVTGEIYMYA